MLPVAISYIPLDSSFLANGYFIHPTPLFHSLPQDSSWGVVWGQGVLFVGMGRVCGHGESFTPPLIPTGLLLDSRTPTAFTRTPAKFILADHHTNLVSQSYWSPSKFLLESLGIADS